MNKMYANLHFHSIHSDGPDTVETLVHIAKEEGYKALALADHDTATGVLPMMEECKKHGLEFIVGTEFSGLGFDQTFHIVGLDFDMEHPRMKEHLAYMSKRCVYRTKGLFDDAVLNGRIKGITWEEVEEANKGITFLCADHVFAAMKKKGIITEAEYPDFHKNNFSYRIPFENIYEDKSIEEVVSIINEAGGVAVLAHPGNKQMDLLPKLIKIGIKGIEAWHPDHTDEEAHRAESLAEKYNLYISGGTDHSGLMGGQYQFYKDKSENPYYIPSLKYGTTEENFKKLKNRVLG